MPQIETKADAHILCPHCNDVIHEVGDDGFVRPDSFRECPHASFLYISGNSFAYIAQSMEAWLIERGIDEQDEDFLSTITNPKRNPFITQLIKHEEGNITGYYGFFSR